MRRVVPAGAGVSSSSASTLPQTGDAGAAMQTVAVVAGGTVTLVGVGLGRRKRD